MFVTVKPARLASIPQAKPVGPAPITITSNSGVPSTLRSMHLGYLALPLPFAKMLAPRVAVFVSCLVRLLSLCLHEAVMTIIRQNDLIQSVADALQFISYYHPVDFIKAMTRAYEKEQSPAARDAIV